MTDSLSEKLNLESSIVLPPFECPDNFPEVMKFNWSWDGERRRTTFKKKKKSICDQETLVPEQKEDYKCVNTEAYFDVFSGALFLQLEQL